MTINTEGGLRPSRIEYVPEGTQGVTPTEPDFQLPSDRVTEFEIDSWGPEAIEKSGLGDVVHTLEPGMESPAVNIAYDMQRWPLDNAGAPNSLETYGLDRNSAGIATASLTIVERMRSGDQAEGPLIEETSTVEYDKNGSASANLKERETHIYTVLKGCDVAEPTLIAERGESDWAVEAALQAEHGRSYQIDQPDGAQYLHVQSTDAADTDLHVTIEDSTASTSATVKLDASNATTPVPVPTEFTEIDAIEVYENDGGSPATTLADHAGDIEIYEDDGTGTDAPGAPAAVLAILYGSNYYDNTYGDPGVPTLGAAGSRGAPLGTGYYKCANMAINRPPGESFEATGSVQSVELAISNSIERTAVERSREQRLHQGMMVPEATLTIDSETGSHTNWTERMAMTDEDMVIEFTRDGTETITFKNSTPTESGRTRTAGENSLEQEVTMRAQKPGLVISNASA